MNETPMTLILHNDALVPQAMAQIMQWNHGLDLKVGLGTLRVNRGIRLERLVILLCILLGELSLVQFLVQILDQEINHGNDAVALFTFLLEVLWCLRSWARVCLLGEHGNSSACNATWGVS